MNLKILFILLFSIINLHAAVINSCVGGISGNNELGSSFVTTSSPCITLSTNTVLDMKGYTITQDGNHYAINFGSSIATVANGSFVGFNNTKAAISLGNLNNIQYNETIYNISIINSTQGLVENHLNNYAHHDVWIYNITGTNSLIYAEKSATSMSSLLLENITTIGCPNECFLTKTGVTHTSHVYNNITMINSTEAFDLPEHTGITFKNIKILNPTTRLFTNGEADALTITNLSLGYDENTYETYLGTNTFATAVNPLASTINSTQDFVAVNKTNLTGLSSSGIAYVKKQNSTQTFMYKQYNATSSNYSLWNGFSCNSSISDPIASCAFTTNTGWDGYFLTEISIPFTLNLNSSSSNYTVYWTNGSFSGNFVGTIVVPQENIENNSIVSILINNKQKYQYTNTKTNISDYLYILSVPQQTDIRTVDTGVGIVTDVLVRAYVATNGSWGKFNQQYSDSQGYATIQIEEDGHAIKLLADKDGYEQAFALETTDTLTAIEYYLRMSTGNITLVDGLYIVPENWNSKYPNTTNNTSYYISSKYPRNLTIDVYFNGTLNYSSNITSEENFIFTILNISPQNNVTMSIKENATEIYNSTITRINQTLISLPAIYEDKTAFLFLIIAVVVFAAIAEYFYMKGLEIFFFISVIFAFININFMPQMICGLIYIAIRQGKQYTGDG